MHAQSMIATHPQVEGHANEALIRCIEACHDCALSCTACADACLGEPMVAELRQCIRLCLDCADLCALTATLATRRTGSNDQVLRQALELCADACRYCADECRRHAGHHAHCRICAEICQDCFETCATAAPTLAARPH